MQALHGRNGEAPLIVLAPQSPGDCFDTAIEAVRLTLRHMTPVMILSDGYLANGSEPWPVPDPEAFEPIVSGPAGEESAGNFQPYARNERLARPWAIPGTPGLEHRVGGLEKARGTGNVSYDPENHQKMTLLREEKIRRVQQSIPPLEPFGSPSGDLLVLSWGGTFGSCHTAVARAIDAEKKVSHVHLRHLSPFPPNLREVLGRFKQVLVPELNMGQLRLLIRGRFLVDARGLNKVQGRPFLVEEIEQAINQMLDGSWGDDEVKVPREHHVVERDGAYEFSTQDTAAGAERHGSEG